MRVAGSKDLFTDDVNPEGDKGDAEPRDGVAELVCQHGMLPPLIPPPEELPSGSQWFGH